MTDIFLSYTEKDREQARRMAAMLEAAGWTVWWDRRIPAGETWRSVLDKALGNMRCMIVLWSARSIKSEWVYEEATEGRRLGKLVPVMIEAVRPPAGFREIQAADLTNWDGSSEFDGMRMLITDLENILGKPVHTTTDREAKPVDQGQTPDALTDLAGGKAYPNWWLRHRLAVMAVAGALLLVASAVYLGLLSREPVVIARPMPELERVDTRRSPLSAEPTPTLAPTPPMSHAPVAEIPARVKSAPAPVAKEETTPPVAKLPLKERAPVKRVESARANSARCADLLYKTQLGESLSYEAESIYQKECQQ